LRFKIGKLPRLKTLIVVVAISVVAIGASVWWLTKPKLSPMLNLREKAVKIDIVVEAEGSILHYREKLFWSKGQFSRIMQNRDEFSSYLIENFSESLPKYGEREEKAVNTKVEFNETGKSTLLTCDIQGAMASKDYFTFRWLLGRFGLDFINNRFQESEKELSWEGTVNSTTVTITIRFLYPISHCHAHVWRK